MQVHFYFDITITMFRMAVSLVVLLITTYVVTFTSGAVTPGEFKWLVSIKKGGWHGLTHNCSGSIITSSYVLTAASCVDGELASDLKVIYGDERQRHTHGHQRGVIQIKMHTSYNRKNFDGDVAVLQLRDPINLSDNVTSMIGLAKQGQDISTSLFKSCGWGPSKAGGPPRPELDCAQLHKVDHDICAKAYAKKSEITNSMICLAGGGGGNFCPIDKGGGAVRAKSGGDGFELVAIKSGFHWSGCGKAGHPGVFTDVSKYSDWIYGSAV